MTRINYGIKPSQLSDQLLRAELRELPRIFGLVVRRIENGNSFNDIPKEFVLGRGHVTFFFDKITYLAKRRNELRYEYRLRTGGQYYNYDTSKLYTARIGYIRKYAPNLCNDIKETQEGRDLVVNRIITLSNDYKRPHTHRGRVIEYWAKLLK